MTYSLSYYITLLVIKVKGIKRSFSKNPIEYKKIRKEDVHIPKGSFFKAHVLNRFNVLESKVTEVGMDTDSNKLLIFIHGGAFISGPTQLHWKAIKLIAKQTDFKIWLCDYPKAPEYKIKTISKNIDKIYQKAKLEYGSSNIYMIGDSVGGTLVIALIQRLIKHTIELPKKIILISPVMDATMSNSEITEFEEKDPMLSKTGVLSAKKMCIGSAELKDQMISPIYGSFEGFPSTTLFVAQNDIMYPDEKLAIKKLNRANVNLEAIEGINMPHIWPFLPLMKESKVALRKIMMVINSSS